MAAEARPAERRTTLRDVADAAGVSIKTASRVINQEAGVAAPKVAAVEQAVLELHYRRDVAASTLRRTDGRTAAIAVIVQDVANPYSGEVLRAVEDVAAEAGVVVFSGSVDEDPQRERTLVQALAARRADGLIVMPSSEDHSYFAHELAASQPTVFVDRPPSGWRADAVVSDNESASARAVAHLIAHGHRDIALLADHATISTARQRRDGHHAALRSAGIDVREDLVHLGLHDSHHVVEALRTMLDGPRPPTAVFSAQNYLTMTLVRHLHRTGRQRQVAVVGFDDFPMADVVDPGITVVRQHPREVGREAARLLFARLAGHDGPPTQVVVPTTLVERGSGELAPQL